MIRFLTDTAGVKDAVDDVEGTGSKIKDWAGKAALAIGGAFAVDKVVEFGKASVDAAAKDAAAQANLAQQLKNSAGASDAQVKATEDWISKASKQYAVADDDLRPAMGNLVRGFGDVGKATGAMGTALDVAAGTGKDLGSVTEAMMKGAQGNTGALGRMGVATKDAAGHALSMDQIMGNLATTFKGQASTAADSAAGRMANAKIQFGEFQEQIGGYLLPVLATLAGFFTNTLLPAISGFVDWLSAHKDIVVAALIGFGIVVGAVVVPAFIAWAIAAGTAAIATLAAAAPFIAIGVVIAAVAYLIISNWDTIKAVTVAVWNTVVGAVQFVWNWIKDNWPILLGVLLGPIALAAALIYKNWDTIKQGATDVYNWIKGKFDDLVGFFTGLPARITSALSGLWDGFSNAARAAFNAIAGFWNGTIGSLSFHVPSWVPALGGKGFDVPDIPTLASGGIVRSPTLAMIGEAGPEAVVPLGRAGTGPAVHIEHAYFNDRADVDMLMRQTEFAISAGRL
jgi:hypothetical protein